MTAQEVDGERSPLQSVDYLLLGYLAVVSAAGLLRRERVPGMGWLLVAHGLVLVLLYLVTRPGLGPVGRALRELYPLVLLAGLYSELDVLNGPATRPVHDALVQHWELAVFGSQVSRTWWQAAPSAEWSAILHSAYLAYYAIITAPAIYFTWRGDLRATRHFVLAVMTAFVSCYLVFLFFPVAGPYYVFPRPAAWFIDNAPARLVYRALASGSAYGAAFPSSHVAATVAAALAAWRGAPRLALALLVPTGLLTVGVVYCQMHYGVDAIAGLVVGVAAVVAVRNDRDP